METKREKFYMMNSMLCLLKVVEGKRTTVEMRDEKEVTGVIKHVDGYMNISMEDVVFKSLTGKKKFDKFFVNGKTIRYVHIPDEINMKSAMEAKLKEMCTYTASMRVRQEIKDQAWAKLKQKERRAKAEIKKERK
ncbi:U7 snRNA-associated Sm-like protein LSm10 isoform X2 [Mercenaria mercenaria]|uniref:U7 snRNA-associated Sm-like protein LSm10 isoform X2 n=1 Tax=Mercenaria mercenaria TaxID=6596 RepID=UPI001E1D8F86|nr:U7 snRNA-associated Sm-like protein LSm10 isoform X2 [Mercenaria mercenaria]